MSQTPYISYDVTSPPEDTFAVPFQFWEGTDLIVEINDVPTMAFNATGMQNPAGGEIILTVPVSNSTVIIQRNVPLERWTEFPIAGPFRIEALNNEFDRIIAMLSDADYVFDNLQVDWSQIQNKPATFPPSPHIHPISDVTGLQTDLDDLDGRIDQNATDIANLPNTFVEKAGDTMTDMLKIIGDQHDKLGLSADPDPTFDYAGGWVFSVNDLTGSFSLSPVQADGTKGLPLFFATRQALNHPDLTDLELYLDDLLPDPNSVVTRDRGDHRYTRYLGDWSIGSYLAGQIVQNDGSAWIANADTSEEPEAGATDWDVLGGGASVEVGDTAPSFPGDGDLWYRTSEPVGLYVYYDDGDSSQWVQTNGGTSGATSFHDPTGEASWRIVGNTLECWGLLASSDANPLTINFPKTFADLCVVNTQTLSGLKNYSVVSNRTTTSADVSRYNASGDDTGANILWHAIGEWDGVS